MAPRIGSCVISCCACRGCTTSEPRQSFRVRCGSCGAAFATCSLALSRIIDTTVSAAFPCDIARAYCSAAVSAGRWPRSSRSSRGAERLASLFCLGFGCGQAAPLRVTGVVPLRRHARPWRRPPGPSLDAERSIATGHRASICEWRPLHPGHRRGHPGRWHLRVMAEYHPPIRRAPASPKAPSSSLGAPRVKRTQSDYVRAGGRGITSPRVICGQGYHGNRAPGLWVSRSVHANLRTPTAIDCPFGARLRD